MNCDKFMGYIMHYVHIMPGSVRVRTQHLLVAITITFRKEMS